VDRHLKERLVGAAVLVAAANILIPEMLSVSGPNDNPASQAQLANSEAEATGVKTYTIDLTAPNAKAVQTPPASAPTFLETTPAPPPELSTGNTTNEVVASPKESNVPAPASATATLERDQRLLQEFSEQEKTLDTKPVEKPIVKDAAPAKPASEKNPRHTGAGTWAVQVASFGVRATSERIASELKAKGYPAFVTSYTGTGQTMYRVRVGPVEDRAAADALLKKIKPIHPGAAVVPQ
jgi:DedD protein